ncbi:hypothetical protein E4U43_003241 [Claviceps pusilla]|uniref:Uncharacterized protein n=1 Tax=Claviceps pusilla TaxID=123648 RepID=A0A9P7SXU8_9HYPO|nr:hypothetical protein E4U43_003241 [Claviceps pusilla]
MPVRDTPLREVAPMSDGPKWQPCTDLEVTDYMSREPTERETRCWRQVDFQNISTRQKANTCHKTPRL